MRILGIITNLAMTTRRQLKDNRMKNLSASLLIAAAAMLFTAKARATVVDLTTAGSSGQIGGAFFFQTDQQPAGTGFIDPFIRVQDPRHGGFEQGYNTDGGFPFDDKHPHGFQHSLALSSLATFTMGGVDYFKFMLDSNESGSGSNHQFTLQQLQIFTTNDPAQMVNTFDKSG